MHFDYPILSEIGNIHLLLNPLPLDFNTLKTISSKLLRALCWRRQWHPTPVLLPGKSHGRRSLVGCSQWGR